jgi:hypothetical protein
MVFLTADFLPEIPSEAQVQLDLKKDEEAEALAGCAPLHGTSATVFLTASMQLEESQCVAMTTFLEHVRN